MSQWLKVLFFLVTGFFAQFADRAHAIIRAREAGSGQ
jgi:hypothetical protein